MSDLAEVRRMIAACEQSGASLWSCINDLSRFVGKQFPDRARVADKFNDIGAYLDAAVTLLPSGAVWRAYTDRAATVYGQSPYKADAQERFDGFADERPLAICAALLRMIEAPLAKLQADQLRRELAKTGGDQS